MKMMMMSGRSAKGGDNEHTLFHWEKELEKLERAAEDAKKARERVRERESELLSRLPESKALSLTREKRVVREWQARRGEWDRISRATGAKIGKRGDHLMMSTAVCAERERNEFFDTLDECVPPEAKQGGGEEWWEISLRNHGERTIPVGNIFSGLFVTTKAVRGAAEGEEKEKKRVHFPDYYSKMLDAEREGALGSRTWKQGVKRFLSKKREKEMMKRAPPLNSLKKVVGEDLFEWAMDGIKAEMQAAETAAPAFDSDHCESESREEKRVLLDDSDNEALLQRDCGNDSQSESTMKLRVSACEGVLAFGHYEMGSPPVSKSFEMINEGSGVVFYDWRSSSSSSVFLCLNTKGKLLPGERKSVVLWFDPSGISTDGCAGMFWQDWQLKTLPSQAHVDIIGRDKIRLTGEILATIGGDGDLLLSHREARVRARVEKVTGRELVKEVLLNLVSGVRTPPRESELRRLQYLRFSSSNDTRYVYSPKVYADGQRLFEKAKKQALLNDGGDYGEEEVGVVKDREIQLRLAIEELLHNKEGSGSLSPWSGSIQDILSEIEKLRDNNEEEEEEEEEADEEDEEEDDDDCSSGSSDDNGGSSDSSDGSVANRSSSVSIHHQLVKEYDALVTQSILYPSPSIEKECGGDLRELVAETISSICSCLTDVEVKCYSDAPKTAATAATLSTITAVDGDEESLSYLQKIFGVSDEFYQSEKVSERVQAALQNKKNPDKERLAFRIEGAARCRNLLKSALVKMECQFANFSLESAAARERARYGGCGLFSTSKNLKMLEYNFSEATYDKAAGESHQDEDERFVSMLQKLASIQKINSESSRSDGKAAVTLLVQLPKIYSNSDSTASSTSTSSGVTFYQKDLTIFARDLKRTMGEENSNLILFGTSPHDDIPKNSSPFLSLSSLTQDLCAALDTPVAFETSLPAALLRENGVTLIEAINCDGAFSFENIVLPESEPSLPNEEESDDDDERILFRPPSPPKLSIKEEHFWREMKALKKKTSYRVVLNDMTTATTTSRELLSFMERCCRNEENEEQDTSTALRICISPKLREEVTLLHRLLSTSASESAKSMLSIVGGSDLRKRAKLIESLIDSLSLHNGGSSIIFIGGRASAPFLCATGRLPACFAEDLASIGLAQNLLSRARSAGIHIQLPLDLVIGQNVRIPKSELLSSSWDLDYEGEMQRVTLEETEGAFKNLEFGSKWTILDIGISTIELLKNLIEKTAPSSLLWVGPLGALEWGMFGDGTRSVLGAVVEPATLDSSPTSSSSLHKPVVVLAGETLCQWCDANIDDDEDNEDEAPGGRVLLRQSRSNFVPWVLCGVNQDFMTLYGKCELREPSATDLLLAGEEEEQDEESEEEDEESDSD